MQQEACGFGGSWFLKIRFRVIEKEDDVGGLAFETFFDWSCSGIACIPRIQDGDRSMAGYVAIDPSMHGHQSNIHLFWHASRKKGVDDSMGRYFARSDQEEPRRPLLEEQFF